MHENETRPVFAGLVFSLEHVVRLFAHLVAEHLDEVSSYY